ncbi:relaxase/mobilization nuclease domain-containing protein [Acinetobacter sp. Ver3]|uniref:relaxase/mobilization nuclease domain-containing protein n=1 Tax=Acinetobacter sp. Ver3 TaxID=466088 RepID=UPI00044D9D69|nr:mobilization protein [Acinetobacter sp. Ver3]EZQ01166.1 mobilization protein [Acinetobacter sp. Ver3]
MKVHIKFLNHGKGNAAKASAYLLDKFDHMGNVRAGIEVLRGDATTFNAICDASPHLWKYTSGVIAWSKDDAPTDEQIREVLTDFEQHAFSGLDPSQYHLFAVQHTDDDGSKHIHVLVPRLDLQSGKSLNIAPPGHEKHFDSLRDYFNTKYQWSRPDDLLLMHTTQEPNHIAKLNAQAKKILSSQELEALSKKQFYKAIDNYVRTLLKTNTAKNRAEIITCIKQLDGVDSIKPNKESLTVTLNNGKKHRIKGDFYHENFEIGSYSEHLRAAAESGATASELAAALTDAEQLRATYRAKREAYNQQQYAFVQSAADDNSARIASKRDFERNREFITPSHKIADSELQRANRRTHSTAIEYRYIDNQISANTHRVIFNISADIAKRDQQQVAEHRNRQAESTKEHTNPSTASDSEPKRTDRERNTNTDFRKAKQSEIDIHSLGGNQLWNTESFNEFLSELSSQHESKDHRSTKTNNSAEQSANQKSNQNVGNSTEVSNADRNRPLLNRAKQLVIRTKQLIDSTNQFIKNNLERIQRSRAELKNSTQTTANLDFSTTIRNSQNRTGELFRAVTASISRKLENPIESAINQIIESTGFKNHCQQLSNSKFRTDSNNNQHTTIRHRESTLENLAIESSERLLRRFADAKQADQHAWENSRELDEINRKLERLEIGITEIRLKPKPALDFKYLRSDGYYPDYVAYHKEISEKQQQAYKNQNQIQLIVLTSKKIKNIEEYINRLSKNLTHSECRKLDEIIKNDRRMLRYLECEKILEPRNSHLKEPRELYQSCLKGFETIKNDIREIKNPSQRQNSIELSSHELKQPQPRNDFDLDM